MLSNLKRLFFKSRSIDDNIKHLTKAISQYQVIIHAGPTKTGSTFLQKYFTNNLEALSKLGYYYPHHPIYKNGTSPGHASLPISKLKEEYIKSKNQGKKLLLSSECYIRKNFINQFLLLFPKQQFCIIVFHRNPFERLVSEYNQSVKRNVSTKKSEPMTSTLKQFAEHQIENEDIVSSGTILYLWKQKIGQEAIFVLPYSKVLFSTIPLHALFLGILGDRDYKNKKNLKEAEKVNLSYTKTALRLKLLLNEILDSKQAPHNTLNSKIDQILQPYSDRKNSQKHDSLISLDTKLYNSLYLKLQRTHKKISRDFLSLPFEESIDRSIKSILKNMFKWEKNSTSKVKSLIEYINEKLEDDGKCIKVLISEKLRRDPLNKNLIQLAHLYDIYPSCDSLQNKNK